MTRSARRRLPNYVLGSIIAHGFFAGGALFVASKQSPISFAAPAHAPMEIEFIEPPRQEQLPQPAQQPTPQPPAVQPEQPLEPNRPQPNARTITRDPPPQVQPETNPNPQTNTGQTDTPPEQNPNPPTNTPPNPQPTGAQRILTSMGGTSGLFAPSAETIIAAAQRGGVAMAAGPTAAQRAATRNESIFGPSRRCTGTPEECARAVASAPIVAAIESQQRPNPAGTGAHSRQVGNRLMEAFSPVRQIPNLDSIVSRGQLVTPSSTREVSAGERAIDDASASRGYTMNGAGTITIPQAPYRMVRTEIEVDQDASGAIIATRVATSSRSDALDRAAERAIREALGEADAFRTATRRRSRWAIEVSEAVAAGRIDTLIRAGGSDPNLGWRVAPENANGMRIRYRVRMVSMRLVNEPAQGTTGTVPGNGRSG